MLHFGNKLNEEVCCRFVFANLFNSLDLLVRLWWNILVANLATNFQDLVAKVKNLVALAPVLGTISCPASVSTITSASNITSVLRSWNMKIKTSIRSKILMPKPMLNLHLHSTSNSKTCHLSQLTQDFFDINSWKVLNTLTLAFNPSHQKWLGLKMTYNRHISSCFKNSIMIHKFWVLYENNLEGNCKEIDI